MNGGIDRRQLGGTAADGGWAEYYETASGWDYMVEILYHHRVFVGRLLREIGPRGTALECGCGSAMMSVFLSMTGAQVSALDRDTGVLERARANAEAWNQSLDLIEGDLFELDALGRKWDVTFSQGVLEHFSDEQIRELVEQSLSVSDVFVFSVPSRWYKVQDFGDERLMDAADWARILDSPGLSAGFEPYEHWRIRPNLFRKKPLSIMGVVRRA